MVRIATGKDAEQLNSLNNVFNGEGETSIEHIRNSLMSNKQEVAKWLLQKTDNPGKRFPAWQK